MRLGVRASGCLVLVLVCALAAATEGTASSRRVDAARARLLQRIPYSGGATWVGTEIAFDGRFAYGGHMGADGGVHVLDTVGGRAREVGFFPCPAEQNDVAVVRRGILAVGFESDGCGQVSQGVQLVDVSDPKRIRVLDSVEIAGGAHTLTRYPGTDLVYASPGGYWIDDDEEIVLDASDPDDLEVVATFDSGPLIGCHDLSFHVTRREKLAVCAGESATQIWDVADPLEPRVLSEIDNPLITFHHSAVFTPDGDYLVIGDERWLGSSQGACGAPANHPTGALWIYDVRDPTVPKLMGFFGLRRGGATSVCTAHDFGFVPGTRKLVAAWYEGGMNVIDLQDPADPREVAYYRGEGADYWVAYWHRGKVYASGRAGMDVLEVEGL